MGRTCSSHGEKVKKKARAIPVTGRGGPIGSWDVEDPTFFQTVSSQMAVRLSALLAGRPLPEGRFLVLISVRG
jgi:hypothetical protein